MFESGELRTKCSSADQHLYDLVRGSDPGSVSDVVSIMREIDAILPDDDGLKWFNVLYLMVTCSVLEQSAAAKWADPEWLNHLDVVFASLYLGATIRAITGDPDTPRSWNALFEARHNVGIDRIQFALAGMNAHINHDLSLALIKTNDDLGRKPDCASPQRADYDAVNDMLEAVTPTTLTILATGTLGQIAQDTGKVGRLLAIWNIKVARALAWDFADHLSGLDPFRKPLALTAQDKLTGALGRSLLLIA